MHHMSDYEHSNSIDELVCTSITVSCYRETSRLYRVLRVYETALNLAYQNGDQEYFRNSLKKLHDHKGQLTATWRSVTAFMKLKHYVQKAWEAECEWEIVHEDEGGGEIGGTTGKWHSIGDAANAVISQLEKEDD